VAAKGNIRRFPTAYKLQAIRRAEAGEGVLPVARKLGISRKLLHDWIKAGAAGPGYASRLDPKADFGESRGFAGQASPAMTAERTSPRPRRHQVSPQRANRFQF